MTIYRKKSFVYCLVSYLCAILATPFASAEFTTIINVPPDPPPLFGIGSDTQLNLLTGGSLFGFGFDAGNADGTSTNIEVNVAGGDAGNDFDAYAGSTINISAGNIGNDFTAHTGSIVNITGGHVGDEFKALDGSTVDISDGYIGNQFSAEAGANLTISGGTFGDEFTVNGNVDINGGTFGYDFTADNGSTVNFYGGDTGPRFRAWNGSTVNFYGGHIGSLFRAYEGSNVNLFAGEFFLDGVLVPGLDTPGASVTVDLENNRLLSFTFADGSVKTLNPWIAEGTFTLTATALPARPDVIQVPDDPAPQGLRSGQTLNLNTGGVITERLNAVNASINILGGTAEEGINADAGTTINMLSGSTDHLNITNGSTAQIHGGYVDSFTASYGGEIYIHGGEIGPVASVYPGGIAHVTGGNIDKRFHILNGGTAHISGGRFAYEFWTSPESTVHIYAAEVYLDGEPVTGLDAPGDSRGINVPDGSRLTLTLADGSVKTFGDFQGDRIDDGAVTLHYATLPTITPVINVPTDPAPNGLRQGQTLYLNAGGNLGNDFTVFGSTLIINGGEIGDRLIIETGSSVTLNNGIISNDITAFPGSSFRINGGYTRTGFVAYDGVHVYVDGGSIGPEFEALAGSIVEVNDGYIGRDFQAHSGSTVIINGGRIGDDFIAHPDTIINITDAIIGEDFKAYGATINIHNSEVRTGFTIRSDSTVNIYSGTLDFITNLPDTTINLYDGNIRLSVAGTFNMYGGAVGHYLQVRSPDAILNIRGGTIGEEVFMADGNLNLFGTYFMLDGIDITPLLTEGLPMTISDRDVILSGTLADGSAFSFELNQEYQLNKDYFTTDTNITVTLVPEPATFILFTLTTLYTFKRR